MREVIHITSFVVKGHAIFTIPLFISPLAICLMVTFHPFVAGASFVTAGARNNSASCLELERFIVVLSSPVLYFPFELYDTFFRSHFLCDGSACRINTYNDLRVLIFLSNQILKFCNIKHYVGKCP